jgi:hypothetical protein
MKHSQKIKSQRKAKGHLEERKAAKTTNDKKSGKSKKKQRQIQTQNSL